MRTHRIDSWSNALIANRKVPTGDMLLDINGDIIYSQMPSGDRVPWELFFEFYSYYFFINRRCTSLGIEIDEYICNSTHAMINNSKDKYLLLPRWTFPFCYFGPRYFNCFVDKSGIDVGCIINKKETDIVKPSCGRGLYDSFNETFVPHFRYYREIGCSMTAIDIQIVDLDVNGCGYGDLRKLEFLIHTVDFITVPMIIGPGNPMNTFLDLMLCLSEMKRVLKPDGLIYISDFTINTSLVLACWISGFHVYYNNIYPSDLPIGLFLLPKYRIFTGINQFSRVSNDLKDRELIPCYCLKNIRNRDLLFPDGKGDGNAFW